MFDRLSISFIINGPGEETLRRINENLNNLRERFRRPFQFIVTDNFNRIRQSFSNLLGSMNNGIVGFGNIFGNVSTRIARIGRGTFSRISNFGRRLNFSRTLINGMRRFSNYSLNVFNRLNKSGHSLKNTFAKIIGVLGTGATLKIGLEGAANIEQYRNTLETVLKDPIAAQKKLAWSSRLANRTPFETEEVVAGMTKLQSYGIEGDRVLKSTNRTYIEMIGDMASAMNKPLEQAIEAIADSRTGELERLKEFGITKNMIGDFGKKQGYGDLFNNKGQINDLQLFNKALFEMMNSKFGGAMEKQAKTFKGAISTIKGVSKSALSTLFGMDEFGNAIENSPFQLLRDKVLVPLSEKLIQLQEQGVFTKWAEGLANSLNKVISFISKTITFCKEWKEILIPLVSALAGLFIINKLVYLFGALQVIISAFSFNPILFGIGATIAALVFLYRNWDKVWKAIKDIFNGIVLGFKTMAKIMWIPIQEFYGWLDGLFNRFGMFKGIFTILIPGKAVFEAIESFFGAWNSSFGIIDNLKNGFTAFFESLKNSIKGAIESFTNLGDKIKNLPFIKGIMTKLGISSDVEVNPENIVDGSHKTGLDYVPFDGYIAELHKGERVVPANENRATPIKRNNTFNININVTGSSNGIDFDKLGSYIVEVIQKYEEEKEIAEGVI